MMRRWGPGAVGRRTINYYNIPLSEGLSHSHLPTDTIPLDKEFILFSGILNLQLILYFDIIKIFQMFGLHHRGRKIYFTLAASTPLSIFDSWEIYIENHPI